MHACRRAIFLVLFFYFSVILSLGTALAQPKEHGAIAFTHINLVSMKADGVATDQTVVVEDGKIIRVGPAREISAPKGAWTVDGEGQYLMPGLADLHVHLFSADDLLSYASNGVTTVLNMSGSPMHLRWREQVRHGSLLGPTIYTAGPTIDGYPPLNEMFVTCETPEQAAALIRKNKRDGYDFIKLYGTLRPDAFRTILKVAEQEKIPVAGHINRQVGALEVLKSPQVLAAHLEDLIFSRFDHPPTELELEEFAAAIGASKITVTPNLNVNPTNVAQLKDLNAVLGSEDAQLLPPAAYSQWSPANNRNDRNDVPGQVEQAAAVQKILYHLVNLLRERGVRLVLGTDAAPYGIPGISAHEELAELVEAGFTPYQALRTATVDAGAFVVENLPTAGRFGTVEEGSVADLVLLSANPLADIHNTRKIAGVMVRGNWLPASKLDQLEANARKHSQEVKRRLVEIDAALESGEVAKARKIAEPLAGERSPWIAEWVLMTKARKLQSAKPAAAADIARWSTDLYPDSFSAHFLLADVLFQQGKLAQAKSAALESKRLEPYDAANLNLLEKIELLEHKPSFGAAGTYSLQLLNDSTGESQSTDLQVEAAPDGHWSGKKSDPQGQSSAVRSVIAASDRLWVVADTSYGPLELRITVRGDNLTGYWAGPFGRNGKISGKKTR